MTEINVVNIDSIVFNEIKSNGMGQNYFYGYGQSKSQGLIFYRNVSSFNDLWDSFQRYQVAVVYPLSSKYDTVSSLYDFFF